MNKKPRKKVSKFSGAKITAGEPLEPLPTNLPDDKEGLEEKFAKIFIKAFNTQKPCGEKISIDDITQNGTEDLDFKISCEIAEYLELAELTPMSEAFGRTAFKTGELNVKEYADWISSKIISKKSKSYGDTAYKTILLLYTTHTQFLPSQSTLECIKSYIFHTERESNFKAIFYIHTIGDDGHIERILPLNKGESPYPPNFYRTSNFKNQNILKGKPLDNGIFLDGTETFD